MSWQEARACLRLLLERGWLLALVGVIALSAIFSVLGRWQYGRHEGKVLRNERIDANYDAAPVPLDDVLLAPSEPLADSEQWTPVTVTGRYQPQETVLVRNRPLDGVYGFEVLVPLRMAGGEVLMVDRGWVPNGRTGAAPDASPTRRTGTVDLVVRLRPGEPGLDRTPPAGQQLRIDLPRIAEQIGDPLGERMYQAYGVLAESSVRLDDPSSAGLLPLPRPDQGLGPHLAYAVQWWAFAVVAYLVLGYYLLREVRLRAGTLPPATAGRRRSVDEEWEDRVLE